MSGLSRVVVVRSSNRPIDGRCLDCVAALLRGGVAGVVDQRGSADVALQRNVSLSQALRFAGDHAAVDVVLMVDDDIVFGLPAALAVTTYARKTGRPASGCYALADGELGYERLPNGRYLSGLGFLAVPVVALASVATLASVFEGDDGQTFWEFTTSASAVSDDGRRRWVSEDFRFTRSLGGVDLLPVVVGHLKSKVVLPDRAAFAALTESPSTHPEDPAVSP